MPQTKDQKRYGAIIRRLEDSAKYSFGVKEECRQTVRNAFRNLTFGSREQLLNEVREKFGENMVLLFR